MQIASRIQVTIDLLDVFFENNIPFDVIMSKFFKNNRWIGAEDRREISNFAYDIFRNFETLRFYTQGLTGNFGRAYVLSYLKKILKREDIIEESFSGQKYHPSTLSDFEKKFLLSLEKIEKLPEHALLNYPEWLDSSLRRIFQDKFSENLSAETGGMPFY